MNLQAMVAENLKGPILRDSWNSEKNDEIHAEQVKILYHAAPLHLLATLINAALLVLVQWQLISPAVLSSWFLAVLGLILLRYYLTKLYKSASLESLQSRPWDLWFTLGVAGNGMLWGAAGILFFPSGSIVHQVFLAFVLGGMAAGTIGAHSAVFRVGLLYVALIMIPVSGRFIAQGNSLYLIMGLMLLLFAGLLLTTLWSAHSAKKKSLWLRFENSQLVTHLRQANERLEAFNADLRIKIAEKESAEAALRESEQMLASILQALPIAAFVIDRRHRVIHWNLALEKMTGIKAKDALGSTKVGRVCYKVERPCLANLLLDDFRGELQHWYGEKYQASALIEEAIEATDFYPRLAEKGKWLHFTAAKIRNSSGIPVGAIEILEDITERRLAEIELRESEKRFRDLVENSPNGICIVSDGRIFYLNSEMEKILGPIPMDYDFKKLAYVHPEDVEKVRSQMKRLISGEAQTGVIDVRVSPFRKTGEERDYRWLHLMGRLIHYEGAMAILVHVMDITKTMELEHLVVINDKMMSLGRVATGIIHELRSPLSGINVYLSTLKKMYQTPGGPKGESLEKGTAILARLQSASDKIESVIKRAMDFAKPGVSQLRPTDINHAIEEAIGLSAVLLRKNGIKVSKCLEQELPMCYTDSPLIQQVILNLITNAVQAMKTVEGEKRIEVCSWSEGNLVCISIADSGPGVAPALRRKIFDPFFTTKQEGVGIGLSLCHRVISDHGGSLSVSTSKWGGAEFQVQIPIEKRKPRT
jgi:PAS domain S-box-containing protein